MLLICQKIKNILFNILKITVFQFPQNNKKQTQQYLIKQC